MTNMTKDFLKGTAMGVKIAAVAVYHVAKACVFTLGIGTAVLLVISMKEEP